MSRQPLDRSGQPVMATRSARAPALETDAKPGLFPAHDFEGRS